ncbi:hypothetical protein M0R89_01660 [Halorussus limi]|uniref:Uncharacterized protein n=1 Tax=Halorussus limi TaxID=2938695 RepID=A0A8U0HVA9_9EURY|nr:hypothetical protein [Halorussus limi]UPV74789.1 hypothetical protein M0R89_01660 [Halorussus limi]
MTVGYFILVSLVMLVFGMSGLYLSASPPSPDPDAPSPREMMSASVRYSDDANE